MPRFTSTLAAGATALALLLTACGGDSDRPSVDELSDQIEEEGAADGITSEQADCVAEAFVDSDISDEGLREIVDNPDVDDVTDLDLSDDDTAAAEAAVEGVTECILGDLEDPGSTEGG
ncbi:hypothetical protein HC251_06875 [Iamia sp. SCSIO 61187]|uniref:hypothetical protein n=1 Tax=Iamia sp. SCSIO 61187 TaxID=2722752 RepID=UPI001C6259C0|nr:hypothetical protein [Iamia sp. SCSIO 61187]QYG92191.1 hypothetical protein HC251_06875 [Iamia sp. SCSIO 61187]